MNKTQKGTTMLKKTGTIHDTPTGYDFRTDDKLTPMKAIRGRCLDCCVWNAAEVGRCPCTSCTLWPYRFGKTGNTRNLTDSQKKAGAERLKASRIAKTIQANADRSAESA